ncbi:MAG: prepilin-type N-terminal cleavage/methylation domain-containing protein [Fimbriimonadaceae bacterium]
MRTRAFTLIELLTAMALSGIVLIGTVAAMGVAVRTQNADGARRAEFETKLGFENRIRKILGHAYVSSDPNNTNTYFIGRVLSGGSELGDSASSDELVFTAVGMGVPSNVQATTETDFEQRNATFGPVGGPTEIGISMQAVGDAGDRTGIFIREQHPADSDTELGGYESVLDDGISGVSFEFFDGTDWIGEWGNDGARTLPLAVRVTYQRTDEEDTTHVFVVRMPSGTGAVTDAQ